MNELIERLQEQLDNNWAVEAEDIQALIDLSRDIESLLIGMPDDAYIRAEFIGRILNYKSHRQSDSE